MIYAKLAAAVVLIAAIFFGGYHVADLKGKAALAALQHAWDVDKAQIQGVTDAAIAQATKDKEAALEANGVIQSDYQTQLSAANARAAALASGLRNLENRIAANSGGMPKAGSGSEPADPTGAPSLGRLNNALGAALNECATNRAQLNALIAEIRPQL
jgi:hypothetical protein